MIWANLNNTWSPSGGIRPTPAWIAASRSASVPGCGRRNPCRVGRPRNGRSLLGETGAGGKHG
nr:MAG TPA: hypothetical protein [Caudoviricetes sp.]